MATKKTASEKAVKDVKTRGGLDQARSGKSSVKKAAGKKVKLTRGGA